MRIKVRVAPGASKNLIKDEGGLLKVYLTAPAHDGLANKKLVELLSDHLGVKKYRIRIAAGEKSRDKLIEIDDALC